MRRKKKRKGLKITSKGIQRFLEERVYGWDLRFTDEEHDNVLVVRYVGDQFQNTFREETKSIDVRDFFNSSTLYQIHYQLRELGKVKAFQIARELVQNREGFSIGIDYKLKELRYV